MDYYSPQSYEKINSTLVFNYFIKCISTIHQVISKIKLISKDFRNKICAKDLSNYDQILNNDLKTGFKSLIYYHL